jgi:hypothetical protein
VTYNQVAGEDLENLSPQARAASKHFLQKANQDVPHGSTDESAVDHHLRNPRANVVAMLAAVVREPRSQNFLKSRQCARRDHLSSERVCLQLLEVCLKVWLLALFDTSLGQQDGYRTAR